MVFIWDYPKKKLEQTEKGKILIIERMINNGMYLGDNQKLSKKILKKYWSKIKIDPDRRRYLHFLIWEK